MSSKFTVFAVSPSSPQFFGEIVIIVGAILENGGNYKGECFVLVERCMNPLYHTKISVDAADLPSSVLTVDLDFVLDAALGVGKGDVANLLNSRFEQSNDLMLFARPIEYQLVEPVYLVRRWMNNKWQKEILKIFSTSECNELINFLKIVKDCPTIKFCPTQAASAETS